MRMIYIIIFVVGVADSCYYDFSYAFCRVGALKLSEPLACSMFFHL